MISLLATGALAFCLQPTTTSSGQEPEAPQRSWTITADWVYTVSGDAIENGAVTVTDGRISAVGSAAGEGDLHVTAITPGLVDLGARISLGDDAVEQVHESTPAMRITDAWNPYSTRFGRELQSGVTTVLMVQPDRNVIGGLGAAVKTGGPLEERLIADERVVSAVIGSQPSSGNSPAFRRPNGLFNRRPTTRMGVEWVARKAFYDAIAKAEGVIDPEPLEAAGLDVLGRVLNGELPLFVAAEATQDIRTAIFLKEEFGFPHLILDSAAEAWKEPKLLQRSGASVVLPPFAWSGRTGQAGGFMAWNTVELLEELGVTYALSGQGNRDRERRLFLQPAFAVRAGGTPALALAAATLTPAQMIGIDDRVGSIEVGKDADLCFWNGEPTRFTTDVIGVMVGGELAVDPREASAHKLR